MNPLIIVKFGVIAGHSMSPWRGGVESKLGEAVKNYFDASGHLCFWVVSLQPSWGDNSYFEAQSCDNLTNIFESHLTESKQSNMITQITRHSKKEGCFSGPTTKG